MNTRHPFAFFVVGFALLVGARAQCTTHWLPGDGVPGVSGDVRDIVLRDPDGNGPLPAHVLVGGHLNLAGDVGCSSVADWDPATQQWTAMDNGFDGFGNGVDDLLLTPDGDLYAAGSFRFVGDANRYALAHWDGTGWSPVGSAYGSGARLGVLPNGNIVVGGTFQVVDEDGAWLEANLAVWNGAGISMPFGFVDGPVLDLVVGPDGQLFASGQFWSAGGVVTGAFAHWNGTTWSSVGASVPRRFALLPNGDLVGTELYDTTTGFLVDVAVWDGATWTALPPTGSPPANLLVLASGDLLVTTTDTSSLVPTDHLLRWTGAGWNPIALGDITGAPLAEDTNGDLLFRIQPSEQAVGVARWNGATWSIMGSGITFSFAGVGHTPEWSLVETLARMPNGDLLAGGTFAQIGGVSARGVARWDGVAWSPLGNGIDGHCVALAALPNGDVVAAGEFTLGSGQPVLHIARWDGSTWSPMPWTQVGSIRTLAVMPNGDLIAAGVFTEQTLTGSTSILRWDGASWTTLRNGVGGEVKAMVVMPNGDLIVGGQFVAVDKPNVLPGGGVQALRIARWDGAVWSPVGGGMDSDVQSLTVAANGDLIAGGTFTLAGGVAASHVARFDGGQWSALGAGLDSCGELAALPDGDLVGVDGDGLQRWNGGAWTPIAQMQQVRDLRLHGDQLVVAGGFYGNEHVVSVGLARLATTCPASATAFGAGCNGATLLASTLPWVEGTLRATGTGLPTTSLVVAAIGFLPASPSLQLSTLLPQALPGCELFVLPDQLQALTTGTGIAESSLFVPSAPAIVGLSFYQQMVAFDLDAAGAIAGVVSTNALQLTAGQF